MVMHTAYWWDRTGILWAFVAILAGVSVAYAYWTQVRTGFRFYTGDIYDGFIALAIHEHWFNVLRGLEPWDTVMWFYPSSIPSFSARHKRIGQP